MNPNSTTSPNTEPQMPGDGRASAEFPSAEHLIHAPEHEYVALVARHWDDYDWDELWQVHIASLDDNPKRRQLLHDTAKANTHPTLDAKLLRCHLTRLEWAGFSGGNRCDAENEIVDWACECIREWKNWSYGRAICSILRFWKRDLDAVLRDALYHGLANAKRGKGCAAIIPVIYTHSDGDPKLREVMSAQSANADTDIREAAKAALKGLSMPRTPALFKFSSESTERRALADGLNLLAKADASIKRAFLSRLQSADADYWERGALARALGGIAELDDELKEALLERVRTGAREWMERRGLLEGLAPLALRDALVRVELVRFAERHTDTHYMEVTKAMWPVLRADRLS